MEEGRHVQTLDASTTMNLIPHILSYPEWAPAFFLLLGLGELEGADVSGGLREFFDELGVCCEEGYPKLEGQSNTGFVTDRDVLPQAQHGALLIDFSPGLMYLEAVYRQEPRQENQFLRSAQPALPQGV
jgi:hypothetical protein